MPVGAWRPKIWEAQLARLVDVRVPLKVVLHGKFVLAGGSACVEEIDPETNLWHDLPPMAVPRRFGAAGVALNDECVVAGGADLGNWSEFFSVEAFSPEMGLWRALPPMPACHTDGAAVVLDGKIVLLGGFKYINFANFGGTISRVDEFDPATQAWRGLPPMPTARESFGAAVLDGQFVVVGGFDEERGPRECRRVRLDPKTQAWRALPAMDKARYKCPDQVWGSKLIVVGNDAGSKRITIVVFDPAPRSWAEVAMPWEWSQSADGVGKGLLAW